MYEAQLFESLVLSVHPFVFVLMKSPHKYALTSCSRPTRLCKNKVIQDLNK